MTITSAIVAFILFMIMIPAFGFLLIYCLNLYFLILIALWKRIGVRKAGATLTEYPVVTVQVPLYNERYVSRRIIDSVARLDWPPDKLQIQVLDDSTDETQAIVAEGVACWREQGVNIDHVRRESRVGYKAGALAYGLPFAKGEYIAIFDADFIPPPSFLKATLPHLLAEPQAAFVQARWDHVNRAESWLTRVQAVALDGHFTIEQFARSRGGFAFNFNGTAGIWRRKAIEEAGGWQSHTLTEDLDLSYRAWLRGWHGLYRNEVTSPAELPPTMTAFRRQQARWNQGGIECARTLLPMVWRSQAPLMARFQATIHLLGYLINSIMVILLLVYPLLLLALRQYPDAPAILNTISFFGPLTIAPTVFFFVSQMLVHRFGWRTVIAIAMYQLVGAGMVMNTLRATLRGILKHKTEFLRTPKWGDHAPTTSTYRLKADIGVWIDVLWGFYCLLIALTASLYNHHFIMVYSLMSFVGSWWVALWTIWPDVRLVLSARRNRSLSVQKTA